MVVLVERPDPHKPDVSSGSVAEDSAPTLLTESIRAMDEDSGLTLLLTESNRAMDEDSALTLLTESNRAMDGPARVGYEGWRRGGGGRAQNVRISHQVFHGELYGWQEKTDTFSHLIRYTVLGIVDRQISEQCRKYLSSVNAVSSTIYSSPHTVLYYSKVVLIDSALR